MDTFSPVAFVASLSAFTSACVASNIRENFLNYKLEVPSRIQNLLFHLKVKARPIKQSRLFSCNSM